MIDPVYYFSDDFIGNWNLNQRDRKVKKRIKKGIIFFVKKKGDSH